MIDDAVDALDLDRHRKWLQLVPYVQASGGSTSSSNIRHIQHHAAQLKVDRVRSAA